MSKGILVVDMTESCLKCPMLNSSDECILQDEDANFKADSWEALRAGCPLVELPDEKPNNPELRPGVHYSESAYEMYKNGWKTLWDKIVARED